MLDVCVPPRLLTFCVFGSRVSECIPDQPRLFVWIVQAAFSSTGAVVKSFLDCDDISVMDGSDAPGTPPKTDQTKGTVNIRQAYVVPGVPDVDEAMLDGGIHERPGDLGLVASGTRDVDDGDVGLGSHGCGR